MKTLATLALAAFVLFASNAQAQPEPGDAGIFGDVAGDFVTTLDVLVNVPYNVSAVAFDLEGGLFGYEVGLTGVPVGTFALSTLKAGPAPLDVGNAATYDYIVGTGGCVELTGGPVALITWQFLSTVAPAADTAILLRGTNPSSFGGVPGYLTCDGQEVPFTVATDGGAEYPDSALILNATGTGPVDNDEESFGSVKARF